MPALVWCIHKHKHKYKPKDTTFYSIIILQNTRDIPFECVQIHFLRIFHGSSRNEEEVPREKLRNEFWFPYADTHLLLSTKIISDQLCSLNETDQNKTSSIAYADMILFWVHRNNRFFFFYSNRNIKIFSHVKYTRDCMCSLCSVVLR